MKKSLFFTIACFIGIACAEAAVRGTDTINRTLTTTENTNSVIARTATQSNTNSTSEKTKTSTTRRTDENSVSRVTTQQSVITRDNVNSARSAAVPRSTTINYPDGTSSSARNTNTTNTTRSASTTVKASDGARTARSARSTSVAPASVTNTFGTEYNQCRNAYFTCMDQFCAMANDTYRRCVCSSRLTEVQERQRALKQAAGQLQDFKDLNIDVIPKTAEEVNAMLTATEGEKALTEDTSKSASTLAGIREVLSTSKTNALNTLGTLDIAGDINQIWATTDLASGENIANLTGEALYNAVHAQCSDFVSSQCSKSTLNMVVSAYGMYIENDCSALMNALDTQLNQANSSIRTTEREMNTARLDNYNAHNSTSINDCIAQVRKDITSDTVCGSDYVHCLDITGHYLNRTTGEPIYSRDFYQLEYQTSLEGDVLTNATNRLIVAELNKKRIYAERGLETCRDIADYVWDEFVRQAIVEIYQGQQEKVRTVKNECMEVVNACYDTQSNSLKDFSNIKEELLLGSRLELSETLCQEKLYACSNLYGDPNGNGLELLVTEMNNLTDQKIFAECKSLLEEFAVNTCLVPSNDSLHDYPYGCRVYAPGDGLYASKAFCNRAATTNAGTDWSDTGSSQPKPKSGYTCEREYLSCKPGYYLASKTGSSWKHNPVPVAGNECRPCPTRCTCLVGGTSAPVCSSSDNQSDETYCGDDYIGSLYQQVVRYAIQVCIRPSEYENVLAGTTPIPENVLHDVNSVMDSIKVDMSDQLSIECSRLGGTWVDTQWLDVIENGDSNNNGIFNENFSDDLHDETGQKLFKYFYDETGSNKKWGFCAEPDDI